MFNSSVVFGPDGKLLGKYDKTHLAPGEEKKFEWGQSLEPVATPFGKLGIFTCWDINFPEITRIYQLKGAEILLWTTMPHGQFAKEIYGGILQSRCILTGLPMGVSTFAVDDQLRKRICMNSMIFDAHGEIVAGGRHGANALVKGVVDLDDKAPVPAEWGFGEDMTYPKLLKISRRPELYGPLTEKILP
jgi:predicted amidohydrolase